MLRRPLESAQYTSFAFGERCRKAGVAMSVGSRGDSYDNAMAESVNGLYKTELVRRKGRWRGREDLELATLEWVDWFNHRRFHGAIGYVPPAESRPTGTVHQSQRWLGLNKPSLHKTRGGSIFQQPASLQHSTKAR